MKKSGQINWFFLLGYTILLLVLGAVTLHQITDVAWSLDRLVMSALFILVMPFFAVYFYMPHIGSLLVYALFAIALWRYRGAITSSQIFLIVLILLWVMTGTFLFYEMLQTATA